VAVAVAIAVGFALFSAPQTPAPLGRGAVAPAFSLPKLGGGNVSLDALRGQVVLVNFWATWCKPCEDEMPAMENLYGALRSEGLELVAISVDEDAALVESFGKRLGLSFPLLLDPDKQAAQAYQTYRFPESFLVDREGVVVERYIGPKEWDAQAYVERIRRLLKGGSESR
jgi:peroxiredoxin